MFTTQDPRRNAEAESVGAGHVTGSGVGLHATGSGGAAAAATEAGVTGVVGRMAASMRLTSQTSKSRRWVHWFAQPSVIKMEL